MKKLIYRILIFFILILSGLILYLSTVGIKTNKLNDQISNQIKNLNGQLEINLDKVSVVLNPLAFKFNLKTIDGQPITLQPKQFNKGQIYGGLLFGLGWALTGACPGPLFAQIGNGATVIVVTLLSAIAGTWFYGLMKDKLPH